MLKMLVYSNVTGGDKKRKQEYQTTVWVMRPDAHRGERQLKRDTAEGLAVPLKV